jgi:hypothetical protein
MAEKDTEITEKLTALFETEYTTTKLTLKFVYNTKEYSITFDSDSDSHVVRVINTCLHIGYFKKDTKFSSAIETNSPKKKCFEPILKTNSRNAPEPRTKNIDVLQVLKTKIALCLPNNDTPIRLFDSARSDNVALSPFSILRGDDGVYEKYGYYSEDIDAIKDVIRATKWKNIAGSKKDKEEMPVWATIYGGIQMFIESTYEENSLGELLPDTPLTSIMQKISFEIENTGTASGVSEQLFEFIAERMGIDTSYIEYLLNPRSQAWRSWNQKLRFTDIKVGMLRPQAEERSNKLPVVPIEERITALKKAIELAESLNDPFFRKAVVGYRASLKGLEAERNAQGGGSRRRQRRNQTKKKLRSHSPTIHGNV